jgi:hypothetical protein
MKHTRHQYQTPRAHAQLSQNEEVSIKPKRLRDHEAEDEAAVRRGRIDLYVSPQILGPPAKDGRRRRPLLYSNELFWAAMVLRKLERKAYRPLQGYLLGLARLIGYEGEMPDHVTIWRRAAALPLPPLPKIKGRLTITVDSTGVKYYGPGEWRAKRADDGIRREYLKFHAVRDADSGLILDWALTRSAGYGSHDGLVGGWMIKQLTDEGVEFEAVAGDGAYDSKEFRQAVWRGGGAALVPPREDARLSGAYSRNRKLQPWQDERDNQIIACWDDRRAWKQTSGYHQRSLAETTFSRRQALFGTRLQSKLVPQQRLEIAVEVWLLNEHVLRTA